MRSLASSAGKRTRSGEGTRLRDAVDGRAFADSDRLLHRGGAAGAV